MLSFRPVSLPVVCFLLLPLTAAAERLDTPPAQPAPVRSQISAEYGKLPLSFEANHGQTDKSVQYLSHGQGYTLFLRPDEAVLSLGAGRVATPRAPVGRHGTMGVPGASAVEDALPHKRTEETGPPSVVRMQLVGANPHPVASELEPQITRTNYFIGNDPKKWHTDIPNYARVKYSAIYPGVDLVYYGNQRQLEHDFVVAANADPSRIVLRLAGSTPHIDPASGDLILKTSTGELRLDKPVSYQQLNGHRQEVPSTYKLLAANKVGFQLGAYDHAAQLTIDPVLIYSTYLGGTGAFGDQASGIAVDAVGNAYVTGSTDSSDFPTLNPIQSSNFGTNAFVSELKADGSALLFSTYLGGGGGEYPGGSGNAIALDTAGNVYVTGNTSSYDFPVKNPYQATMNDYGSGFVTEIKAGGASLVYSTYLGGQPVTSCVYSCMLTGTDAGLGIAVDSAGDIYVTGMTSSDFPVYQALQSTCAAAYVAENCGFITEFKAGGQSLVYSTYLGGSGADELAGGGYTTGIAVDTSGNAYVSGVTNDYDWPLFHPLAHRHNLNEGAVVSVIKAGGSAFIYSTYLPNEASANGIAVDNTGNAFVAADHGLNEIQSNGSRFVFSKQFDAVAQSVALDPAGNAYVAGYTLGTDLFLVNPLQCGNHGQADIFVAELAAGTGNAIYSTYFGGTGSDQATAIAVDTGGNAYVAGSTSGKDFPTLHPFQAKNHAYGYTAFVFKIGPGPYSGAQTAPPVFSPSGGTFPGPHTVSISDETPGATIYYTNVYGSTPTVNSTRYTGPFTVGTAGSIAAIATSADAASSPVCNAYYGLQVPEPTIAALAGRYDQTQTITLSDQIPNAKIYYTLDGNLPTTSSALYTGPIVATNSITIIAVGTFPGYGNSNFGSARYDPPAAAPVVSPGTNTFYGPLTVTITSATPGANIYYTTTHGATPTTSSTPYTRPFTVKASETVAAIATAPGFANSQVGSSYYGLRVLEPTFDHAGITYSTPITLTISDASPRVTIYYTTDGTLPTASSTKYIAPISITSSERIEAMALVTGYEPSSVMNAYFTIH